jgi:hypothetical protein
MLLSTKSQNKKNSMTLWKVIISDLGLAWIITVVVIMDICLDCIKPRYSLSLYY